MVYLFHKKLIISSTNTLIKNTTKYVSMKKNVIRKISGFFE